MVNTFSGFYIAKYETSVDSSENASTKANQKVKTNISYNQSVELINKYPNKSTSTVGIVTGKQWDTTMKWISNQIGKAKLLTEMILTLKLLMLENRMEGLKLGHQVILVLAV